MLSRDCITIGSLLLRMFFDTATKSVHLSQRKSETMEIQGMLLGDNAEFLISRSLDRLVNIFTNTVENEEHYFTMLLFQLF